MELQTMPSRGLCLPTSFAMVFDVATRELLSALDDNNYNQVVFPGLPEPFCWRGFHVQQFVRYAVSRGFAVTPIEVAPAVAPPPPYQRQYQRVPIYQSTEAATRSWSLFKETIQTSRGVLTGYLSKDGGSPAGHAVAYEQGIVFDPRGRSFPYSPEECEANDLYANAAWRVDKTETQNEPR